MPCFLVEATLYRWHFAEREFLGVAIYCRQKLET